MQARKMTKEELLKVVSDYYDNGSNILVAGALHVKGGYVLDVQVQGMSNDEAASVILTLISNTPAIAKQVAKALKSGKLPQDITGGFHA